MELGKHGEEMISSEDLGQFCVEEYSNGDQGWMCYRNVCGDLE